MTNIVILDGFVANPGDLSWEGIRQYGNLKVYDRTSADVIYERAKEANILIVNKCSLDRALLNRLDQLQCICTLATGYNNIDITAAKERGIVVCNAVGYSSPSVAQQVFALLLELTNGVGGHNDSVQQNAWANAKPTPSAVQLVAIDQLFKESDVLTLHAPLTTENTGIINKHNLSLMKSTAYFINTGRGGLVEELDLKNALLSGQIAGAGLDVLSQEPPPKDHLLLNVPNCLITPHHAWATKASRGRLLQIVADNIKGFLKGELQNVVS